MNQNLFDFIYIDVAFGGVAKRNNIIKVDALSEYAKDWQTRNLKDFIDCYKTYFRYTEEIFDHVTRTGSVKEFNGSCWAKVFPLDIDSENLVESQVHAKSILSLLKDDFDVDPKNLRIYFSGAKGFHIEIPGKLFGGFIPSPKPHEGFRALARSISEDADPAIYDKLRLWRLPNTINSKSGLYKIPLSAEELFNLSIEEIKELAKRPRKGIFFDHNMDVSEPLIGLYEQARQAYTKPTENSKEKRKYEKLINDKVLEGERNTALTSYAGKLRSWSIPGNEAFTILSAVNQVRCLPPLDEREVESIVKSVWQYENETEKAKFKIITLADYIPKHKGWFLSDAIPLNFPTLIYADGGIGKSFLALYLSIQACRGVQSFMGLNFPQDPQNVLYLDWELDPDEFALRAGRIVSGLELPEIPANLSYLAPEMSIYQLLPKLKGIIQERKISLCVIDSLGAACLDPEKAIDVIQVFTRIKGLGVTTLGLDHQPKMQSRDNYHSKTPYGSVYKYNLSRSVFQLSCIRRDRNQISLMLSHRKNNFGRLIDPLMFDIAFEGDRVSFYRSKELTPEERDLITIQEKLFEMKDKEIERSQSNIVTELKKVISKDRVRELLSKGKGKFWLETPREGKGGGRVYEPFSGEDMPEVLQG